MTMTTITMATRSEVIKDELRTRLKALVNKMKEWGAYVETYEGQIKKIEEKRGVWDPKFIEAEKQKIGSLAPLKAEQLKKIRELADDLGDYYRETLNEPLDPERIEPLNNAIQLIQTGVLDYEMAKALNKSFAGDQVALKMLKNAYEKTGTPTGGIDKMVMTIGPEDIKSGLSQSAYDVIHSGLYLNHFSKAVKTLADYWDVDLETQIKTDPLTDQARDAAGLPKKD
jgi:hypothetical protein